MSARTTKYLVMLAHPFKDNKVVYPCIVQPKYDGIRCRAVVKDHVVQLFSRDNKEILSMDHIKDSLKHLDDIELDGELYDHAVSFQVLNGTVRRHTASVSALQVKLIIYDVLDISSKYKDRYDIISVLKFTGNAEVVMNSVAENKQDIEQLHDQYVAAGYEGAMIRTDLVDRKGTISYVGYQSEAMTGHRRSWTLLKYKIFEDAEFTIIGVEEELDVNKNPKQRTGTFIMQMEDGKLFKAGGINDDIKVSSWTNPENFVGRRATIKFFGKSTDGIPRFPNFKDVRWDDN